MDCEGGSETEGVVGRQLTVTAETEAVLLKQTTNAVMREYSILICSVGGIWG